MSYGPYTADIYRRATYPDRIPRGAKPSELRVQFPTKFELVINLTAAKAIGLVVPPPLACPRRRAGRTSLVAMVTLARPAPMDQDRPRPVVGEYVMEE